MCSACFMTISSIFLYRAWVSVCWTVLAYDTDGAFHVHSGDPIC